MDHLTDSLALYRELAERYDRLGQLAMRDRFLMLAADAALQAGQAAEAERLRLRLLQQNRHHMLRPYGSFEEALAAPDVLTYLRDLKANYPPDLAVQLLDTLQSGAGPSLASTPPPRKPAASPVPPTAPIVDPYAPPPAAPKPSWEPVIPFQVVDDVGQTAPLPQYRPLAQPLPGRAAPSPAHLAETAPPYRPTVPVPVPAARPRPAPEPVPGSVPASPEHEEAGGQWLSTMLMGVVLAAALALAAFTLARPFLPPAWLP